MTWSHNLLILKRWQKGFTLIELLVVISIISLLSSIMLSSVSSAREKAKISTARQQARSIVQAIIIAQGETGKTLISFAPNSNAMHCNPACSSGSCITDRANTPACLALMKTVLTEIENSTNNIVKGLNNIPSDPWGYAYMFDSNQGETGLPSCGNIDGFWIVAPGHSVSNFPSVPLSPNCP
jgi:prepilin-type N-terminal cleavage/methylation domain-containing protein